MTFPDKQTLKQQQSEILLPLGILYDFCLLSNLEPPNFQHFGCEINTQSPMFSYLASACGIEVTASRQSKKKAKHAAAQAVLLQLLKKADDYLKTNENIDTDVNDNLKVGYLFLKSKESYIVNYDTLCKEKKNQNNSKDNNPVGTLQEVCMKNKWNPPEYIETEEIGLPHEKIFTIECFIQADGEVLNELGKGKSKKVAKRLSALQMLTLLESKNFYDPSQIINISNQNDSSSADQNLSNRLKSLRNGFDSKFVTTQTKITEFYTSLDQELNNELDKIIKINFDNNIIIDYCKMIEEVANYVECEVQYIDNLSIDNKLLIYYCLVNLKPYSNNYQCPPIVTGFGESSISILDSRQRACKTAITLFDTIRLNNLNRFKLKLK